MKTQLKTILSKTVNFVPLALIRRLPLVDRPVLRRLVDFAHSRKKIHKLTKLQVEFGNCSFYLTNDGSYVAQLVYFQGVKNYEPGELKLWQKLCSASKSCIIEIGSNIGIFTVVGALAKPDKVIYDSFEPHPLSFASLKNNILINKCTNVNAHQSAVGSIGDGTKTTLMIPQEEFNTQSTGAFIEDVEQINRPVSKSFEVELIPAIKLPPCDLLKIDAEGSEFKILDSMFNQIIRCRPVIVVEVRRKTYKLRSLVKRLVLNHSYKVHAISPKGLKLVDPSSLINIAFQDEFQTRDVVVIPDELNAEYLALLSDYYC